MTTLTIMRILPREVDPMVYKMSLEDPGGATFAGIGGLGEQVRELREVRPPFLSVSLTRVPTAFSTHRRSLNFPSSIPNSSNASASRPQKVYFSMAHPGQARHYLPAQSPLPSRPTFSKWSPPLSSTNTSASRHAWCVRCSAMHATMSRASSSWTRSTPSADADSRRAPVQIVRSSAR
jgi:hypothetical protein